MNTEIVKIIMRAEQLCLSNSLDTEWLDDLKLDLDSQSRSFTDYIPLLRGFVRGLYTAKGVEYEDLCEFDEFIVELGNSLHN